MKKTVAIALALLTFAVAAPVLAGPMGPANPSIGPSPTPPRGCRDATTWRTLAKKIADVDAAIAEEQERIKNAEPTLAQTLQAYDKCKATKPIEVCNQTILPSVNSLTKTITDAKTAIVDLKKRRAELVTAQQKACAPE